MINHEVTLAMGRGAVGEVPEAAVLELLHDQRIEAPTQRVETSREMMRVKFGELGRMSVKTVYFEDN